MILFATKNLEQCDWQQGRTERNKEREREERASERPDGVKS